MDSVKGAAAIFAMYILAVILQLNNIVMVFNRIAPYVATALLVIFQPEIRRIRAAWNKSFI